MRIDEDNFITQLRRGNEQALLYVIDTYGWVMKTVVTRQMQSLPQFWDDCMNDTLLAVWEHIDSYDKNRSEFKNWLAGICRMKALSYVRKYITQTREDLVEQIPDYEDESVRDDFLQKEYEDDVKDILSGLTPEDAKIFHMIYLDGYSADEVAREMNMSKTVIYGRVKRGKRKLAAAMERGV